MQSKKTNFSQNSITIFKQNCLIFLIFLAYLALHNVRTALHNLSVFQRPRPFLLLLLQYIHHISAVSQYRRYSFTGDLPELGILSPAELFAKRFQGNNLGKCFPAYDG